MFGSGLPTVQTVLMPAQFRSSPVSVRKPRLANGPPGRFQGSDPVNEAELRAHIATAGDRAE
jgi:hypothetical protein